MSDKFDPKLLCILVIISLVFIINFQETNATSTTIIKNYANTALLSCTTGSAGGNNGNNLCFEEYTGLPAGHRIISGGYDGQLIFNGQQIREYLYNDDGSIQHLPKSIRNFNSQGNGPEPPQGDLDVEKFTGNPVGKRITSVNYKVGVQAGFARVKIYQDDGIIMHTPSITNNFVAGNAINWNGAIWLSKMTGFPAGATIQSVSYNVGTQAGNIRIKIYADDNGTGYPKTLLGESGSNSVGSIGINTIPVSGTIPASGNLWVGFEVDNAATGLKFDNVGGTITITSNHVFGSGPNPIIGTFGTTGRDPYLSVKYNDYNITGYPKTLLGESGQVLVCNSGTCSVPVIATIPASGNVWAGIEFSDASVRTSLEGLTTDIPSALTQIIAHVFTTGPSPFGTGSNRTVSPYLELQYNDFNITGYPKTRFDTSVQSNMNQGVNTVSFPNNATVPQNGNVWLGIFGQHASDNSNSYGAMMGNSSGIPNGQVVGFNNGDNGLPYTFAFDATQLFNSTQAPYSSLSFSNANLILSPTFGKVGSTVTASGSGFTANPPTTSVHNFQTTNSPQNQQNLELQEFTGLPAGKTITSFGLKINSLANGFLSQNPNGGAIGCGFDVNKVMVAKFQNLPAGDTIQNVNIKVFTAAGNVRIKLYDDANGGNPQNLLVETGSIPITGSGGSIQKIPVTATIPADGTIYAGFEMDSSSACLGGFNPTGSFQFVETAHTFGAGPNPIGIVGPNFDHWYFALNYTATTHIRAKIYSANGTNGCVNSSQDCPSKLLGETNSIAPSSTGIQNFTFTTPVVIPSNGTVWAGFESTNILLDLFYTASHPNTQYGYSHVYGAGPTTLSGCGDVTGCSGFGFAEYMLLNYNNGAVMKLKWDGSTLTTNPSAFQADSSGAFSNVNFTVPSSTGGFHTVNASDANDWSTAQFSVNASYTLQFRPTLSDNTTMLTSATVKMTNASGTFSQLANNTGWVKFTGISGTLNMTVFDDKNFESLKLINYTPTASVAKNLATYDYALNCIGFYTGYQSDFIVRINDTDGTYITNMSRPDCTSLTDMTWSMTFSPLGKSGNTFSTSMLTSIGNLAYQANAKQFTVNENNVTTIFTGNTNLISNSFAIGSGLVSHTVNFDIKLGSVQQVTPNPSGSPNPPPPPPITCTDPLGCSTSQCSFGINPDGTCFDPSCPAGENCNHLQCPPNSTLYNNECLATQPQVCPDGTQPVNGVCNNGTPSSCPANTVLVNGVCVTTQPTICPDGSQPVNGVCNNGTPSSCPANTVLVNGNCVSVIPPPPNQCLLGTNPDGSCITSPSQSQCTANPLLCLLGGGAGGKDVTVSGITYTPTVDIVQLGQIKNEVIGVSWDSSSDLIMASLYFSTNSSFGFTPIPATPYNLTGNIGGQSSGQIKYVLTVPSSYCSQSVTTNCLDPKVSTFVVPVSITALLDGKEVRNTIFLKITVLTQQTIATYLILAIALFALLGVIISRIKKKKRKPNRTVKDNKNKTDKTKYLKERKD